MIRKLVVILLTGIMCLIGVTSALAKQGPIITWLGLETGPLPEKYNEAPMLRVKIAAGELPPVEERLPKEPLVVKPIEEIGQYGGTMYQASVGPGGFFPYEWPTQEMFIGQYNNPVSEIMPNIAKHFELSNGAKTLTIYLREGMRWSDGYPFTVDDIMFWWEDRALNKEIYPIPPAAWVVGGEPARFEKVDDYTLNVHFALPNPTIMSTFGYAATIQSGFFDPKHYLKKWHIKYNPDADKLAKEEGYDHWWEAFTYHETYGTWGIKDYDLPCVAPFHIEEMTADGTRIYERNPYFYAVDTAGNQLPYIDNVVVFNMTNREAIELKAVAGELSYIDYMLVMKNYPLYVESAEKGDYRVHVFQTYSPGGLTFGFNLNHKDPVLRKIFQDIRFRQAMSLALNRDEINETFYYGFGTPSQYTVNPSSTFFKKEWIETYTQYDPKEANRLLDEMGLGKRDKDGYRLSPDGKRPIMICELGDEGFVEFGELVQKYWADVGVKVDFKRVGRTLYYEHINANEYDVSFWGGTRVTEIYVYGSMCYPLNLSTEIAVATEWQRWRETEGKQGEEPPEEWKKEFERVDRWISSTLTDEEYKQLAQEIFDFFSEQLIRIGTVGLTPCPAIVKNNLRNVPKEGFFGADGPMSGALGGIQWFFKQ